jgi:hypothetical protein
MILKDNGSNGYQAYPQEKQNLNQGEAWGS